jgi:hypothetical protein
MFLGNERTAPTPVVVKGDSWYERDEKLNLFEEHAKGKRG